MNSIDLLKKAKELLSDPDRWIQGSFAQDAKHNNVILPSDRAVNFCVIGACLHLAGIPNLRSLHAKYPDAMDALYDCAWACKLAGHSIAEFNDSPYTKHEDIMHLFNQAIQQLETN